MSSIIFRFRSSPSMFLRLPRLSLALYRPCAGWLWLGRAADRQLSLLRLSDASNEPSGCSNGMTDSGSLPRADESFRIGADIPHHRNPPDSGSLRHATHLLLHTLLSHYFVPLYTHVLLPPLSRDPVQISFTVSVSSFTVLLPSCLLQNTATRTIEANSTVSAK